MRKHLSLREVKKMFPGVEKELLIDMDEEALEESDLSLFTYKGELYAESHDEYSLAVFRGGKWVELDFMKDRPGL